MKQVKAVCLRGLVPKTPAVEAAMAKLESMSPVPILEYDAIPNQAVRRNNQAVCEAAQAEPAPGGNLATLKQMMGSSREPNGSEYSYFNYQGSNAEELVSILLVKDFEKSGSTANPSPLLDASYFFVGISNRAHTKCTNSIQIILLESIQNTML